MKFIISLLFVASAFARLEQGIYETQISFRTPEQFVYFHRSAFNGTNIEVKIHCKMDSSDGDKLMNVTLLLRSSPCGKEFFETLGASNVPLTNDSLSALKYLYFDTPNKYIMANFDYKSFWYVLSKPYSIDCNDKDNIVPFEPPLVPTKVNGTIFPDTGAGQRRKRIPVDPVKNNDNEKGNGSESTSQTGGASMKTSLNTDHFAFRVNADEIYLMVIKFSNPAKKPTNVTVTVKWKNYGGYLGPIDWSLLPFYGVMCGVYAIYALAWLILSFCQWRDLLRIQFWIGAVIGLGLIEKMIFYMEHQTMNHTGSEIEGAIEFAEIFSCLKKTLSYMLVVIVSVGFGVVKPRLGSTLHKVVGFGFVYFLLCSIEGVVRVSKVQHESVKQKQLVVLPLIFVQLGWFYWVFSSLVTTMRALRLRRNEIKLSMYRHFTHTLIFSCVASLGYMIWSLFMHHLNACMKDWKELWVDTAFWHILFSVLLLVIMILWRPTNNNQRYAFSPLLDNEEDEDDEEDTVFSEAFTSTDAMKIRMKAASQSTTKAENRKNKENKDANDIEEDLKWIEQHIPSSLADKTLPAFVDSDEEREQTKFEISKMQ